MYAPLWCKSNYSFLEGASHPDELLIQAKYLGIPALALTDRDGVYGMVRAFKSAEEQGIRLVCGAQLTVAAPGAELAASTITTESDAGRGPGWGTPIDEAPAYTQRRQRGRLPHPKPRAPVIAASAEPTRLVLLAADRAGWANLVRLVTLGRRRCDKGDALVSWPEVCARSAGLVALWGGERSLLDADGDLPAHVVGDMRDAFGDRLYALLARHRRADEVRRERRFLARVRELRLPLAGSTEVLYHAGIRRQLQDVLTCIRHGVSLHTAGKRLRVNSEHALLAPSEFMRRFADQPGTVQRTLDIAARCTFSLAELRYRYPSERLPDGSTSADYLRKLTLEGAARRYPVGIPPQVRAQVDKELALIEELDYPGYFLTMHELVAFCRRRDILCQGRGSAANSAVCFCLGITAVDPVCHKLLFERFLSRERAEPPDIDLDIEHDRREEVIQHVYGVYGRDHAAMVCNVIRYRPRSAIRDVAKAFGYAEDDIESVTSQLGHYSTSLEEGMAFGAHGLRSGTVTAELVHRFSEELLDFPRHLGIHPGGFLLGHEPVHDIVPIENATMPGRTVIQWDKDDLEVLGLFKVDLLALGALHQLHRVFDLLRVHRGVELSMATIPANDELTYAMMQRADTVGVFQIESRAQMSMLPRLKPECFYDIVVQVSIVRPGPITGGMVHPYLRRRAGVEAVVYPHEVLEPVLERTLGVPLFQEQVMQLAVVAADYTPGEADQLRRDMAAWRSTGRIDQHRERLISRMAAKGIAPEFGERVFQQIRGFGEYGFPESHATSFALIAYATSYVRAHYLPEFTCALLNSQPMGFYSPTTIIGDAQRHGTEVLPIDVAKSAWDCTLEAYGGDFAVRMGFRYVSGLHLADGMAIERARVERPFESLADFTRRAHVSPRIYQLLAEAGAYGIFTGPTRRNALWQVRACEAARTDTLELDGLSDWRIHVPERSWLELIELDHELTSHSTRGHPLAPFRAELRAKGWSYARDVAKVPGGRRVDYVGLVICRQRPGTAAGVVFMTLEDESGFVNVVVWQRVFERYGSVIRTASPIGISGTIQNEEGVVHLVAERAWVPQLSRPVLAVESRDFH
ncbi:MAG TPA: error-prone DNA polymerase [Kofleriaceae bacterium]